MSQARALLDDAQIFEGSLISTHPLLARLPELQEEFGDGGGGRFRLFGCHRDPLVPERDVRGPDLKERRALVPLRWFLDRRADPRRLEDESRGTLAAAAIRAVMRHPPVKARLVRMDEAPLFEVRVLGPEHDLKSAVSAYNRINSAGKRVESEERAFASLVSVEPYTETALGELFSRLRAGQREHAVSPYVRGLERDDLVRRERESRFGFKLFMRAFVIAFAYHSNRSIGASSFSFNAVDIRRLDEGREHLKTILKETVDLLSSVASILETTLFCDDFRMLPDTSSLWPVFHCLVRFPRIATVWPEWIAAVTLRLMLADLTGGELLKLVTQVNEAADAAEAMAVFDGKPLRVKAVGATIRRGVARSRSLTDKYALMLYWLIRRRRANDFSYDANLSEEKANELRVEHGVREMAVSAQVHPEKQHLVPYSRLKELFGLSGARPGRHEAHDLGNLTYISEALNGLTGVGSMPLRLRQEPAGNREAHFVDDRELLRAFEHACDEAGDVSSYRGFCKRRRRQIESAFVAWDAEMWKGSGSRHLLECPVGPPARRRLAETLEDRLRDLKYPVELTRTFVGLLAIGFREGRPTETEPEQLRLRRSRETPGGCSSEVAHRR